METVRSRFTKVMNGQLPEDRLPVIEWASWWDLTLRRWEGEGLPPNLGNQEIKQFFGLDLDYQLWMRPIRSDAPRPAHGQPRVRNATDYEALRAMLYPRPVPLDRALWAQRAKEQARGECILWFTLEGFFWWPRALFGIEEHLLAFYDEPGLMRRINQDAADYMIECIDALCAVCQPDFMTFAEDMSYNHGPMVGRDLFDEFIAPYYRQVIPKLKQRGVLPMIDSDGGIEPLIPWMQSAGLEGILPLERMAGVDVNRVRAAHPGWAMVGGYDKTVMHLGEKAMRREFERLMPAMRSGRFVPSVDHQTPPAVSMEQYRLFVRLLKEYAGRAVKPA